MDLSVAAAVEPERLTWDEIRRRHPDEWVVLVESDWFDERSFKLRSAIVFGHSPRRTEVSPTVKRAYSTYREVGTFWTGPIRGPIPRFYIVSFLRHFNYEVRSQEGALRVERC